MAGATTVVNFQPPPVNAIADFIVDKDVENGIITPDDQYTYRIRWRNAARLPFRA